jgi:hypothetical protein
MISNTPVYSREEMASANHNLTFFTCLTIISVSQMKEPKDEPSIMK